MCTAESPVTARGEPDMRPATLALAISVAVIALAGCTTGGGGSTAGSPSAATTIIPSAAPSMPATAPASAVASPAPGASCDPNAISCTGPLAAGTVKPAHFQPPFSFAATGGWTNTWDEPAIYAIARTGDPSGNTIGIWEHPVMARSDAACDGPAQPGVGTGVADVVSFLSANPGLTASAPKPVSVGGLSGQQLDITVAPTWTQACPKLAGTPYEGKPFVIVLTEAKDTLSGRWWGIGPEKWRVFVLDGGSRGTVFLMVDATLDTFDAFAQQAQPILDSLDLRP
jgi:hypothetical protein